MVIVVKERVSLWKQIWSWPVVGGILFLLLSSGVTFSTTDHSLLADLFYFASVVLFITKFLTWEDARQLDKPKRNKSYGLAIGITLIVLCTIILGNHKLNPSHQVAPGVIQSPSIKHSPETIVENTPNAGATAKDEKQQKQPAQGVKPPIPSSKSNQQSRGQAKRPTEAATGPIEIRQQSSGPSSPNVAQIGNNNQVTINAQPPEMNWAITEDICGKLLGPIRSTGSIRVSIGAFISDPGGANVVNQLARCLPSVPGWTVTMAVLPPVPEAVTVVTSAENESIARTLQDGLQLIGFNASLRIIPNASDIEVWVGKHAFKQR